MSKGFRNYVLSALACVVVLALVGSELKAQNFTNNTGGTYTTSVPSSGTVTMRNATGIFDGTAELGLANASRIAGTVCWNGTGANQNVQARFYNGLLMRGNAVKAIPGACYVAREYYVELPGGNRNYAGTFWYDGTAVAQTIWGEDGTAGGSYNNLRLQGGTAGTFSKQNLRPVVCNGNLIVENTANLDVNHNFTIGIGVSDISGSTIINAAPVAFPVTFTTTSNGTLNVNGAATVFQVNANGTLQLNSTGDAFTVVDGTLALVNDATALLNMNAGSFLNVDAGSPQGFTNGLLARTNMTFDPTSMVRYRGAAAQSAVTTSNVAANNKYGNVVFSGAGLKTPTADATAPNIYMRGTLNVSGGVVQMSNVVGITAVDQPILDMDVTGAAADRTTYGSANNDQYVRGKMQLSGTIPTGVGFTMNNAQTRVTFSTSPTTFQLDVHPGVQPNLLNDFTPTTDVARTAVEWFTGTGTISLLRVGYVQSDLAAFTGNESRMRLFEGFSAGSPKDKILMPGFPATNSAGVDPRYAQLTGGSVNLIAAAGGGTTGELSSGSDIVLGSASLFITVQSGRWTNPNTWDEGIIPTATDNAEVRHLVYVGIDAPAFGTTNGTGVDEVATNNTLKEATAYPGNAAMCNRLVIRANTDIPANNPPSYASLIVGNEDNGAGYIAHTVMDGAVQVMNLTAGLFLNSTTGYNAIAGPWDNKATMPGGGNTINGVWVQTFAAPNNNLPLFGTAQIYNNGNINNNGEIQIGQ